MDSFSFNHESETLSGVFGITDERAEEIKEGLTSTVEAAFKSGEGKRSQILENVFNAVKPQNTGEYIFVTYQVANLQSAIGGSGIGMLAQMLAGARG